MLRNILLLNILWCISVHCRIERFDNENGSICESENILDLSYMGIMRLKNNFVNSSTTTHIDLSYNNIWKIEDGAFDSLPNLKYLNLSKNLFAFGNLNFTNLSAVETLVLDESINNNECSQWYDNYYYHRNQLIPDCKREYSNENTISPVVSMKLSKLKKLYLRQNTIRKINLQSITSLNDIMPSLTHLYLSKNELSSVNFLKNFPPTLTHLYLENNHISEFNFDSFLNSLKVLSLDGNKIRTLCSSYQNCIGMSLQVFGQLQNLSISNGNLKIIESNSFKYSSTLISLDLSNNRIREIANNTFHYLTNLKTLILNVNQLGTIPNICDLVSLEHFSISHNSIKSVGVSSFCSLLKLKKLNLSNNALDEIIPGSFDKLDSLEELDLSENKLVNLATNWISSKINLQYLNLRNNLFVQFSSLSLSGIQSLQYVNIGGNPLKLINIKTLKALPENTTVDIGSMSQVFELMLRNILMLNISWCISVHCMMERFPGENGSENILNLSNMGIMRLKNNFVNSSTITHIDLSDNNIWIIEDGAFHSLTNLKYLNLSKNLIPFRNFNFVNLSAVETLVLDRSINNIECSHWYDDDYYFENSKIPDCKLENHKDYTIAPVGSMKLSKLKKLYLRRNGIRQMNLQNITSLSDIMPSLTHLYLSKNELSSVNFLKNFPPTLTHLYLDNNHISEFRIDSFPNSLKVLSLDGNKIRTLCSSLQNCTGMTLQSFGQLQNLSISNANLEIIESNSLKYSSTLIALDLSHNRIREIASITFHNLTNLKTLILDVNQLGTIPNICDLVSLEHFSITYNKLKSVNKSNFCSLSKLKKLILSNNVLTKIASGSFDKLNSLEELDLSNNKLVNLATNWISSKINLKNLNLGKNLFEDFSNLSLTGTQSLQYVNIDGNPLKLINTKTLKALPENTTVEFGNVCTLKMN
ncbi:chaoptin-like [Microplitis mediator]|uniref:chaoptin-like n=1 Tax=Microplitis mediator TaxID=375433 RepID=UPI0025566AAC|nr:chaoptin-like [Microplitis mediator]